LPGKAPALPPGAFAGADAARRLRVREPHHGRLGKRYPVLSTVVCGVPV
jgi:hypothetical protein